MQLRSVNMFFVCEIKYTQVTSQMKTAIELGHLYSPLG